MPLVARGPVPLRFHSSNTAFCTSGTPRTKSSKLSVSVLVSEMLSKMQRRHYQALRGKQRRSSNDLGSSIRHPAGQWWASRQPSSISRGLRHHYVVKSMEMTGCLQRWRFASGLWKFGIVAACGNSYQQCRRKGLVFTYWWVKRLCWNSANANGHSVFKNYLVHFGVTLQVQVRVHGASRMNIGMSWITSATSLIRVRFGWTDYSE